jgi:hypothetical protein
VLGSLTGLARVALAGITTVACLGQIFSNCGTRVIISIEFFASGGGFQMNRTCWLLLRASYGVMKVGTMDLVSCGLDLDMGRVVSGGLRAGLAVALIVAAAALGGSLVYLLHRGLATASLWATFLVLPLTVIIAVAAIWAAVLAARVPRDDQVQKQGIAAEDGGPPRIGKSGDIHQGHSGTAVAHTGAGDIIFNASEEVDLPDEPA